MHSLWTGYGMQMGVDPSLGASGVLDRLLRVPEVD